jgi:hypothetical protein
LKQFASNSPDLSFLSAWQAQVQVAQNPHLKQQFLQREGELLPRFAEHYHNLIVMPRRMRRAATSLEAVFSRSSAAACARSGASTGCHD